MITDPIVRMVAFQQNQSDKLIFIDFLMASEGACFNKLPIKVIHEKNSLA